MKLNYGSILVEVLIAIIMMFLIADMTFGITKLLLVESELTQIYEEGI